MTDHQALTGMSTSTNHNRRLTRWALNLQNLDFSMQYRPVPKNSKADILSRQYWGEEVTTLNREECSSSGKVRNRQDAAQNLQNPSTPGEAARTLEEGDVVTRPQGIEEQNFKLFIINQIHVYHMHKVRLLHMEGSCALKIILAESDWSEFINQDNF